MSKRPTKPFAPRTIAMLESPAWSVVSLAGRRVLDRVEIELAQHGGRDNGRLPVTYRDFEVYGIDRHSIGPALRELQHLGFIQITEHGIASPSGSRSPNLFRLTYRDAAGKSATDDWANIASAGEAQRIASAARQRVKAGRSRDDRTMHFSGGGFSTYSGGDSPPKPVGVSPPKASKTPAKRQVENLHHYLDIYPSREGAPLSSGDPRPRSGPRPPRQRRRRRARVRTNHSKQEGNTHGKH
jgi:hypothetical protein